MFSQRSSFGLVLGLILFTNEKIVATVTQCLSMKWRATTSSWSNFRTKNRNRNLLSSLSNRLPRGRPEKTQRGDKPVKVKAPPDGCTPLTPSLQTGMSPDRSREMSVIKWPLTFQHLNNHLNVCESFTLLTNKKTIQTTEGDKVCISGFVWHMQQLHNDIVRSGRDLGQSGCTTTPGLWTVKVRQ